MTARKVAMVLATFVVNVSGAFVVGYLAVLFSVDLGVAPGLHRWRTLSDGLSAVVGAGMMGGLSTFSTFVFGAFVLVRASMPGLIVALISVLASVSVGYAAVCLGMKIGAGRAPMRPDG